MSIGADKKIYEEKKSSNFQYCFMLTGFNEPKRQSLISIIKSLKGTYISDSSNPQKFLPKCTHIVACKPCRSEKYLCACASGKWILKCEYLLDCKNQRKWLNEESYEWAETVSPNIPRDIQEAPRRWRIALSSGKLLPFHSWVVGLYVSDKSLIVYKRLIEAGGGVANNLKTTSKADLSHVLVDLDSSECVREYHNRGIPCVRPEYVALFLLNPRLFLFLCYILLRLHPLCPTPQTYSVFARSNLEKQKNSRQRSVNGACVVKLDRCDTLIQKSTKTRYEYSRIQGNDGKDTCGKTCNYEISCDNLSICNHSHNNNKKRTANETGFDAHKETDSVVVGDVLSSANATSTGHAASNVATSPGSSSSVAGDVARSSKNMPDRDSFHNTWRTKIDSSRKERSGQQLFNCHKTSSGSESGTETGIINKNKNANFFLSAAASMVEDVNLNTVESSSFGKKEENPKTTQTNAMHTTTNSTLTKVFLSNTVTLSRKRASTDWSPPEWLKEKRPLLRKALQLTGTRCNGCDKVVDLTKDQDDDDDDITKRTRRFDREEMKMLESFIEVGHTRSLLMTCHMLLCTTSYPPPDLLYLLMKDYLLEAKSRHLAIQTFSLLNSLILYHPPSASHIRKDDIYLQALSGFRATESSLLTAAELNARREVRLWDCYRQHSVEWNFYSTVVKQAVHSEDLQLRLNAVELLTFLTSVLKSDMKLLQKLFWPGSTRYEISSSLKLFLKIFSEVTVSVVTSLPDEEIDEESGDTEEDEMQCDDKEVKETNKTADNDADENEEDDELDGGLITGDVMQCLKTTLETVITFMTSKNSDNPVRVYDNIGSGLADVFSDFDQRLLNHLLLTLEPAVVMSLSRCLLERNCRRDLAKLDQGLPFSLRSIVDRYFHFIPKPKNSTTKDRNPSNPCTEERVQKTEERVEPCNQETSELSDKENLFSKTQMFSSSPGGSKLNVVNRRNPRGETALHRACMQNRPERVAELLRVSGVDPNARDNAGWTPLGEASNHGNLDCVRELLKLPIVTEKAENVLDGSCLNPPLAVDVLACPEEGTTPLHDALSNGHMEVAILLIEKAGLSILNVVDKQGKTPLDQCESEEINSRILEVAFQIASCGSEEKKQDVDVKRNEGNERYCIASDDDYKKVFSASSQASSSAWKKACEEYVIIIRHLIGSYVTTSNLQNIIKYLCVDVKRNSTPENIEDCHVTKSEIRSNDAKQENVTNCHLNSQEEQLLSLENDLAYVMDWDKVERMFIEHLRKMTDDPTVAYGWSCFFIDRDMRIALDKLMNC